MTVGSKIRWSPSDKGIKAAGSILWQLVHRYSWFTVLSRHSWGLEGWKEICLLLMETDGTFLCSSLLAAHERQVVGLGFSSEGFFMLQAEVPTEWDFDQSRRLDTARFGEVPNGMTADHQT